VRVVCHFHGHEQRCNCVTRPRALPLLGQRSNSGQLVRRTLPRAAETTPERTWIAVSLRRRASAALSRRAARASSLPLPRSGNAADGFTQLTSCSARGSGRPTLPTLLRSGVCDQLSRLLSSRSRRVSRASRCGSKPEGLAATTSSEDRAGAVELVPGRRRRSSAGRAGLRQETMAGPGDNHRLRSSAARPHVVEAVGQADPGENPPGTSYACAGTYGGWPRRAVRGARERGRGGARAAPGGEERGRARPPVGARRR